MARKAHRRIGTNDSSPMLLRDSRFWHDVFERNFIPPPCNITIYIEEEGVDRSGLPVDVDVEIQTGDPIRNGEECREQKRGSNKGGEGGGSRFQAGRGGRIVSSVFINVLKCTFL